MEERKYSSYSFLPSALDRGEWSASRPGRALAPGKRPPVPIVQEAGWAPEPVWTQRLEEKSFRLCQGSNFQRPVVQPVARHYTDWATWLTQGATTDYHMSAACFRDSNTVKQKQYSTLKINYFGYYYNNRYNCYYYYNYYCCTYS
jgi:hypothetical protein